MTITNLADRRGPANSQTSDDGDRVYIHPRTSERFVSVTTALKVINKPALVAWGAKLGAQTALENLPAFVKASRTKPCGRTGGERCGQCRECVVIAAMGRPFQASREAAHRGSRVHDVAEHWALTGELPTHDDEIAEFVQSYLAWYADYRPEYLASECTVINRTHGYAGTCDGIVRIAGQVPAIDFKTTDKDSSTIYPEHALQLAAYRHAEAVLLPDGTEVELPATDCGGVVSLRRNGYTFRPVDCGRDTFTAFLRALDLYRWTSGPGPESVKGKAWPKPGATVKPARPAARTTTPKKAAAPKKTAAATSTGPRRSVAERIGTATPAAIRRTGLPSGARLTDDDIPF